MALLHKEHPEYREKIEELLEDCNYHSEVGRFAEGDYDEYIKEEQEIEK